ncbi:MAG: hypothetical protein CSA45_05220 [Gammaproteobacteria bacterium]|nr:MAG: hypothetical protein CSA45_05220 [Gammaproteobacteria bacterium]
MPQRMNIDDFITQYGDTRLFHHLSVEEIKDALKRSVIVSAREGEILVCEEDRPSYLLFVMDGALITSRTNIDGDEVSIRLLGKGDCCMDAVIFMGGRSPISVKAVSSAKVLKIPVEVIRRLVETNIHFSNNMIEVLAYFYKESMLQIDNLAIKDSKTRLGYYLLRTYLANKPSTTTFQLNFKKSIISNYLGITPETFSRMLKKMQKQDKILTVDGSTISLTSSDSLCQFCDATTKSACDNPNKKNC